MYTLVSAPVLGFDLARLGGGDRVAAVLRRALVLDSADVAVLARFARDDAGRAADWTAVDEAAGRRRLAAQAVLAFAASAGAGGPAATIPPAVVDHLERAPLGTLDALLHCLREDVLTTAAPGDLHGPAGIRATGVLADALACAYLDGLPDGVRRRLGAPWVAASRRLPERAADLGPQADRVHDVLRRAASLTARDLTRLERGAETWRCGPSRWGAAVHDATWAVHLQGRLVAAATAQLLLVEAVHAGGAPVPLLARGGWNLLSGAMQGLVVADLLGTGTLSRLLGPYAEALGPPF
jgi:hypothetical protein